MFDNFHTQTRRVLLCNDRIGHHQDDMQFQAPVWNSPHDIDEILSTVAQSYHEFYRVAVELEDLSVSISSMGIGTSFGIIGKLDL